MRVAVTYEDGKVFQHFGHTKMFKAYDVEEGKVVRSFMIDPEDNGHGALAEVLKNHGVTTLICGGIGAGAQSALTDAGINFFGGVTGESDKAVEDLLEDQLNYNPNVKCDHHGEGHTCSGHH